MSLDTVMHPVTKCVIFLEDLLADMVATLKILRMHGHLIGHIKG